VKAVYRRSLLILDRTKQWLSNLLIRDMRSISAVLFLFIVEYALAQRHMRQPPVHTVNRRDSDIPIRVTNKCHEEIYPAVSTQHGSGPQDSDTGFTLAPDAFRDITVSADWQGRVWGRTNCTNGTSSDLRTGQGWSQCTTGDCGTFPTCQRTVS
jgi:hypothetical protein